MTSVAQKKSFPANPCRNTVPSVPHRRPSSANPPDISTSPVRAPPPVCTAARLRPHIHHLEPLPDHTPHPIFIPTHASQPHLPSNTARARLLRPYDRQDASRRPASFLFRVRRREARALLPYGHLRHRFNLGEGCLVRRRETRCTRCLEDYRGRHFRGCRRASCPDPAGGALPSSGRFVFG